MAERGLSAHEAGPTGFFYSRGFDKHSGSCITLLLLIPQEIHIIELKRSNEDKKTNCQQIHSPFMTIIICFTYLSSFSFLCCNLLQNGLNALHLASKEGHFVIVSELLSRGANINAATNVSLTYVLKYD